MRSTTNHWLELQKITTFLMFEGCADEVMRFCDGDVLNVVEHRD
ncbi:VOC family protein [Candidatus Mycolicibacterium alkanivorans]|uniref:VOC family protein n=1 Tax=Candidatus Mycolicibacterium alkanivorans TaxID=2954114 RepID=A0ABS9YSG4_9MYCO|nr:VOC family protein [Candidatus Mycolicibacterium alkanivorans]MCI4674173.1 VOC family protein [Candidatus Mycolicibacterium alkanivorans]